MSSRSHLAVSFALPELWLWWGAASVTSVQEEKNNWGLSTSLFINVLCAITLLAAGDLIVKRRAP